METSPEEASKPPVVDSSDAIGDSESQQDATEVGYGLPDSEARDPEDNSAEESANQGQAEVEEEKEEEATADAEENSVAMASLGGARDVGDLSRQGSARLDSGYASLAAPQGGGSDICKMCHNKVYPMEMLTSDSQVYHKTCYKCYKCHRQLSVGNFGILENQLYCQPHYLELFRLKGSYQISSNGSAPIEVIAAGSDSATDDGIGHAPKLSNIKSKFESFEEQTPSSPSKRKEKVYYAGLQSAKHKYETATSEKEKPHSEKPKRFTPPREGSAGVVESQPQELPPDVVRCYDNGESDDRPAPGSSKNVLARFKEMEQQQQNGGHQQSVKEAPPTRARSPAPNYDFDYTAPVSDATVSESNPAHPGEGVVRSGAPDPSEELPPANATRSALQLWRDKEVAAAAAPPPNPETSERLRVRAREQQAGSNRNVRLPQQQQQQKSDASPERDDGDGAELDQLPPEGTARSMRSLFNSYGEQKQSV